MKKLAVTICFAVISMPLLFLSGCSSVNQVNNVRLAGSILYWDSTASPRAGFNVERRVYRDDVFVMAETMDVWGRRSLYINDFEFQEGEWLFRVRRIRSAFPHGANIYQEWSSSYAKITPQTPEVHRD